MRLKWYGTATILLEQNGVQLLFDPFLSLNNNVIKPPIDELYKADNILVTHGHLDHIVDIPEILDYGGGHAKVFCTSSPRETLISKGVAEGNIRSITPGDVLTFGQFVSLMKQKYPGIPVICPQSITTICFATPDGEISMTKSKAS